MKDYDKEKIQISNLEMKSININLGGRGFIILPTFENLNFNVFRGRISKL